MILIRARFSYALQNAYCPAYDALQNAYILLGRSRVRASEVSIFKMKLQT